MQQCPDQEAYVFLKRNILALDVLQKVQKRFKVEEETERGNRRGKKEKHVRLR